MAYTQTDLDNLQVAKLRLVQGAQVERVGLTDGRYLQYTRTTRADLDDMIAKIEADLAAPANKRRPGLLRVRTSRGL